MNTRVVFEGSINNIPLLIHYPTEHDIPAMQQYINTISRERTFIAYQGEQLTLEEETKFVTDELKKINQNKAVQLLVFTNEQLIGIAGIDLKNKTSRHEGIFG